MMSYEQACQTFGVTHTKRQKIKWGKQQGKAYKLANSLSGLIFTRETLNKDIDRENAEIEEFNADCADDEDRQELIERHELFTDFEVRKVLGQ